MTKRKSLFSRTTAFIAAIVFSMTLLLLFPANTFTVNAENAITAEEAGMKISASIKLNGTELAEGTKLKNGDTLSLSVNWELPIDFSNVNGTFVYDLTGKLKGISLSDTVIPVNDIAIYSVQDNKLYIQLLTGHSSRYGSCSLSGSVNVSANEVDNDNKFTLQFIGTPDVGNNSHITSVPVIITDFIASLSIDKNTIGSLTYNGGKYYQEFEVKVQSNVSNSSDVVITDTGDSIYDFSQMTDVTVNGAAVSDGDLTKTSTGFTLNLGTVAAGYENQAVIKYKVPVDVKSYVENTTLTTANKAKAEAPSRDPVEDTAYTYITSPSITKNGSYNAETKEITWTITVSPGVFAEDKDFVVTDVPVKNLTEEQIKAALGEDMALSKNEFTFADGKYTKTFTTTVTDEQANSVTDVEIKNKATAEFEGIDKEFIAENGVTIQGNVKNFVTKTVGTQNADGTVPWTITIDIPDRNVSKITVQDYNNKRIESSPDNFVITGVNGEETIADIGATDYYGETIQFYIDNAAFLSANRGKTITIKYNMVLPNDIHTVGNTANVNLTIDDKDISDYDYEIFSKASYDPTKFVLENTYSFDSHFGNILSSVDYPVVWGVKIPTDNVPKVGDTFTITDTLPEYMEYVSDYCLVSTDQSGYEGVTDIISSSANSGTVTFTVTVNQALINKINANQWEKKPIYILFLTKLTNAGIDALYQTPDTKTYTNNVSLKYNGTETGTASETYSITPDVKNVVTKSMTNGIAATKDDPNVYAEFKIVINSEGLNLSETDVITATDTLGTNLTLVGEPTITPSAGASYSQTGKVLSFTLADNTAYTITYKVKVKTIRENESITEDQIAEKFGNRIVVDVSGGNDFSNYDAVTENYFRSQGNYTFNEEENKITISGEKSWQNDNKDPDARPEKITIKLTATKTDVNGTVTTEDSTYSFNAPADGGAWSYSIDNLPTLKADGTTITYSVAELVADGYAVTYNGIITGITKPAESSTIEINITNTFNAVTNEVGNLVVTKVWDDNNNSDRKRPSDLSFTLTDISGKYTYTKAVDAAGKATFENIPLYSYSRDAAGNLTRTARKYKLTETSTDTAKLANYTLSVDKAAADGYFTLTDHIEANYSLTAPVNVTATNTYTPETVSVSGTKTWVDDNNRDNKRPSSITVNLLADGTEVDEIVVTAANNWAYAFNDLPKYSNGTEIVYTITEDPVTDYTTSINGYNITNTHTPETVSVSGTKTWVDDNNRDNKRPASITVNLLADGTRVDSKVVTAANNWEYEFNDLPKYSNGTEIVYTITEDPVTDYTTSINGYNITNTHTPETTSVSGTKTWVNDNETLRPVSITVNLYGNGAFVESKSVSAADNWQYTFTNLNKFDNGQLINYTVSEEAVYGYTPSYNGYDITNTYTYPYISVQVTKVWNDDNNRDGKRPASVDVILSPTGDTATLSAANNWTYIFTNLPSKDADDNDIVYTVSEVSVSGYTTSINGYNITNTHTPETVSVSGTKTWVDDNNRDNKRPASITVNLFADRIKIDSKVVTAADNWEYEFNNLPKYSNGTEIVYTITEDPVTDYTTTINGYNITNTHTPETVSVSGTKTWVDDNNRDNKRPSSITVNLLADRIKIDSKVVTAADNWEYAFNNLPKYSNGTEIVYTITEDPVTDYTTAINGYNITNTHTPETVSVSGTKTWVDDNNRDNKRPASITVNLFADRIKIDSKVVTAADNWEYAFNNLPKYSNGTEIVYTITEDPVTDYTTSINGYNITNTHTPTNPNTPVIPPNTPNDPGTPPTPNRPVIPFVPVIPDEPDEPEDVSSEAGIEEDSETLGTTDTTPYLYIAILIAITTGGIIITKRRQK